MKRLKGILLITVAATLLLTACQDNNTSDISSDTASSEVITSATESDDDDSSRSPIGRPLESLIEDFYSNHSEPEKPREPVFHYAKEKDRISSNTDYDAIVYVCTDLYYEYGRLTAGKDAVLNGFTDNENFKSYINYMAKHSTSAEYKSTPLLDNVEMTDYPQYNCIYVRGAKSSYGGGGATGIAEFIVTVRDGRLYISDCFISEESFVFGDLRSSLSAEGNHDFWENPDKYQLVLDAMKNNP